MKQLVSIVRLQVLCLAFAAGALATVDAWGQARSHATLLSAFREVAATPAKSTAIIYCDGYRSAIGTVVREDGHIVTKASELKGKIEVQVYDTRGKKEAKIVDSDPTSDLALLKIDATGLTPIEWSDTPPPVGSWLVSPGLYREKGPPLTIGVMSVAARKVERESGALGVLLADSASEARILEIVEDMAADKAGLKAGDVVLKVNDSDISSREQLQDLIKSREPGDEVKLLVKRGSEELKVTVTLGSRRQLAGDRAEFQNSLGGPLSTRRAGFPSVIQHDTILLPADCGGPIVDLDGKAVGVNIARAGRVESYALPASVVQEFLAKTLDSHLVAAPAEGQATRP